MLVKINAIGFFILTCRKTIKLLFSLIQFRNKWNLVNRYFL